MAPGASLQQQRGAMPATTAAPTGSFLGGTVALPALTDQAARRPVRPLGRRGYMGLFQIGEPSWLSGQ